MQVIAAQDSAVRDGVPERPAAAPGVSLVGEAPGLGFEERQWLVERDGRFLQLTELLYRILEHADGRRTLSAIAEAVTDRSEWLVGADDVRHLVATRLAPLGLVDAGAARPEEPPSALAIKLKAKLVGPRLLEPVTAVLQWLFTPPVVVVALAAATAAHVWVYAFHGLTAAAVDTIYQPASLLVLLGVLLVAAGFHELGHAAALRYGGGRARGMGVGLYLVFPVFYTDVTDSYRLGRSARIRTGLGGIYFHLLFVLALIGAWALLDEEFLLLGVALINVEVARQFAPFVRLDGYWVLADLIGVPDFHTQLGPFLRSLLPAERFPGPRLPKLRRWARNAFLGYIAVTVPVLGALVVLGAVFLPTIATALWDAAATQAALFSFARDSGDWLAAATAGSQLVLLALSAVGLTYTAYVLVYRPLRAVWTERSVGRRLLGTLVVAVAVVGLAYWWAPQLPFAETAAPAGVETFELAERAHVRRDVEYTRTPPVGGAHAPVWQNCGFYASPVRDENAVHSLEHGAVWIAYRPGLAASERRILRRLTLEHTYVLVSPYPGLGRPLVASAWGRQLALTSANDARLERFVRAYRLDERAPEAGGPCTGGKGRAGAR